MLTLTISDYSRQPIIPSRGASKIVKALAMTSILYQDSWSKHNWWGTAFFITDRHLVTAASNIWNRERVRIRYGWGSYEAWVCSPLGLGEIAILELSPDCQIRHPYVFTLARGVAPIDTAAYIAGIQYSQPYRSWFPHKRVLCPVRDLDQCAWLMPTRGVGTGGPVLDDDGFVVAMSIGWGTASGQGAVSLYPIDKLRDWLEQYRS